MLYYLTVVLGKFRKLSHVTQCIVVACLLTIVAACTVPVWLIYSQNHASQTSIHQPAIKPYSAPRNSISGKPVRLDIPSLQIDLPVIDGKYDPSTHGWTLSNYAAQYFVDSARPNNVSGKTFIYGHYRKNVFSGLHNIRPSAALSLDTSNGYRFNYRFESSFTTTPSDLSILSDTKEPVLYVQTCSGVFFQHRQIFSFRYVGYEKIKA
jgi:LPXTG-site transpeptidase (sortase) family protein